MVLKCVCDTATLCRAYLAQPLTVQQAGMRDGSWWSADDVDKRALGGARCSMGKSAEIDDAGGGGSILS
ncbi:MAG: hypothetical protein EOO38_23285 [Cytophagaceae bacterium]|nr:MAG: hypothetical protein EOO38_23285 [Cytophagaceae bacterium]